MGYRFSLEIDWVPEETEDSLRTWVQTMRKQFATKHIVKTPHRGLPIRLWEQFATASGITKETQWGQLKRETLRCLITNLKQCIFSVDGKSLNKEEFVTCGGVALKEIEIRTMESRICPGLYFAGEICDIDGITGGFNFQAAWSTGWLAGQAMARTCCLKSK